MTASAIAIHKFWTHYEPDPQDPARLKAVDWVAYGPIGGHDRSVTHDRVGRLARLQPLEGSQNPAVVMAHERWSIIDKHYRAWLAGQEAPVDGTPLAAWNALTPEQADVLRANSIKTVEDVAALTDTHIARLPLPNLRELIRQARHFIDAAEDPLRGEPGGEGAGNREPQGGECRARRADRRADAEGRRARRRRRGQE